MSHPSVAELKPKCQPGEVLARRNAEHWGGRLYARAVSIRLTWLFVRLGLSAGAVTAIMIGVGLVGAVAIALPYGDGPPTIWGPLAGFLLIQLHLVLDCSDGEVARWNETSSAAGVFFDRLGHYVIDSVVIVALGVRAWNGGELTWVVVGLAAALGSVLVKAETDLADKARSAAGLTRLEDREHTTDSPISGLRKLADYLPVHRVTNAIEASMVILAGAVADMIIGDFTGTQVVLVVIAVVAWLMVPAHAYSIYASGRLEPR